MQTEDAVIVGAGPSGLAAAKQLNLYGMDPLVFECDEPGGLLLNACSVVNYPGVREGITGKELISQFPIPQRLRIDEVTGISRNKKLYQIHSNSGVIEASSVIIASGTVPVKISLQEVARGRIFYTVKNLVNSSLRSAAVIGGGDAALDYAMSLCSLCDVKIYSRSDFSKAAPHLMRKVQSITNITLCPESLPKSSFPEDIVVVAVGRKQRVDFICEKLLSSPPEDGSFHMCGDCRNGIYRQTAIAVGNGVEAAMKTVEYLKNAETMI